MDLASLTYPLASRFYQRWCDADPRRITMLNELNGLSLSETVFAEFLQKSFTAGLPLPRAMRLLRNLVVCTLIRRDLSGQADLAQVVEVMSCFAEFAVRTHVLALQAEMQQQHGTPIGAESGLPQQFIVIGMGKLGGRELNVSSDIDLIFCYAEDGETRCTQADQRSLSNHEFFVRLGKRLIAALYDVTEDGFSFRVDMALRPNGASGPLAASFGMLEEYLIVQGREWERYAWVKARALTGSAQDIAAMTSIVQAFVYRRYLDFGMIDAIRTMHSQIRAEVKRQELRHPERSNNVKLGRGGIREIEFLTQVFQLIRGGRDASLRDRSTRDTLRTLAAKQLLSQSIVDQLLHAYTFLRNLEHRLQYLDDAQTHVWPASAQDGLIISHMMAYAEPADLLAELDRQRDFVAAQFDTMFNDPSDPGLPAVAKLNEDDPLETIEAFLTQHHFQDPAAGAERLHATWQSARMQTLPENSRSKMTALINSAISIIVTQEDGHATCLNRLLDFLQAIARRAAYLALLTEYPSALRRVIRMMHASGWAATYLCRHPLVLDELLDERSLHAAPDWPAFIAECQRQLAAEPGDMERQMDILREMHHAQQFRLLAQDLEGSLSVERLADHLSALADALVSVTLQAVWQTITQRHCEVPHFAVIAYGKLGGKELGYASDLDVIFLYDDDDQDAPPLYAKLAQRFITWMTSHTAAGILFDIDVALRPDGASGLLVSSVKAFEKYQNESAWVWEHQALTRARFCAGDPRIGARFEAIREQVLRQPRDPLTLREEVLSMRQKMHDAHPNRSALFDLKQDAGGMIDIEFIVQFLVLRYASAYPQLTADIGNIALLILCGELGLIDVTLAHSVADAYRRYRKLQHQIRLQGEENARIAPQRIAQEMADVKALWAAMP